MTRIPFTKMQNSKTLTIGQGDGAKMFEAVSNWWANIPLQRIESENCCIACAESILIVSHFEDRHSPTLIAKIAH